MARFFKRLGSFGGNSASYEKSNSIETFPYKHSLATSYRTAIVESKRNTHTHRQQLAQDLVDYLSAKLSIPSVKVVVKDDSNSSMLGCYRHRHHVGGGAIGITIWNLTIKRKQRVSNKQFLETLLHEYCHHCDYEILHLVKSLHTAGFYKRISSLNRMLTPDA